MISLKRLPKKYPSFFDTGFALAGIVATQVLDIDPTFGVLAISLAIAAVVIVGRTLEKILINFGRQKGADAVQPLIGKVVGQVLTWGAEFTVGVGFGIPLRLGTWWSVGFLALYFGAAAGMISVKKGLHDDTSQRGPALSPVVSKEDSESNGKLPAREGWFREEDLNLFSKRRSFLMAGYGVLVGLVVSTLITVYAGVLYNPLLNWLWSGVVIGTVLVASLGLLRNRVLKRVAARGFPAVFRFRRIAFTFYIYSVLTGALGLGYGYGYFSAQSTILVLPLAGLFILFLYLYLLWRDVLVESEEGRLCIFQFIAEHGEDGSGFSWLKRGLSKTRSLLESFGVSAKRNSLYFGSSYSLLEGSYLEWDLDNIYFLGDWTSEPNEMRPVHEIASWFLHRSKKAEKRGFSRVFLFIDHLYEISPQSAYYIIAAVGVIVGIVTALLRR